MDKNEFIHYFLPAAEAAGEAYQRLIASVCRSIVRVRKLMALPNSLQSPALALG